MKSLSPCKVTEIFFAMGEALFTVLEDTGFGKTPKFD